MAEVVPTDDLYSSPPFLSKQGRHSRFTAEEDIAVLREVSATNAHVSAFGEARKRYEEAANNLNATASVALNVSWKTVRDR